MLLTLAEVLNEQTLKDTLNSVGNLTWKDGGATAGGRAKKAKKNEQADLHSGKGAKLHDALMTIIKSHPVVQAAARPAVLSVTNGFNSTVFAYGQTGSGK